MKIELFPGIDIPRIRCNVVAMHLVRALRVGWIYRQELVISDTRFMVWPYSEKQSKMSPAHIKQLITGAMNYWPQYKLQEFSVHSPVAWLEALNTTEQLRTLGILKDVYGFPFEL